MADTTTKKIAIITGSTRGNRIGPQVAKFVTDILEAQLASSSSKKTIFTLAPVDIAAFKLPVFDEEVIPAMVPFAAQFAHEHSKVWSAEMSKYDGSVLISACYNAGIPGGVKNALDYLYNEVKGKPFLVISYGITGGSPASDNLQKSLTTMTAHVVETRPQLTFARNEPFMMGMSRDSISATSGTLGEDSLTEWAKKKDEILKGFDEVKEFVLNPAAAPSS